MQEALSWGGIGGGHPSDNPGPARRTKICEGDIRFLKNLCNICGAICIYKSYESDMQIVHSPSGDGGHADRLLIKHTLRRF